MASSHCLHAAAPALPTQARGCGGEAAVATTVVRPERATVVVRPHDLKIG